LEVNAKINALKKENCSNGGECVQKELNTGSFYTGNLHPQPTKLTTPRKKLTALKYWQP
jgi:hypothetical protein